MMWLLMSGVAAYSSYRFSEGTIYKVPLFSPERVEEEYPHQTPFLEQFRDHQISYNGHQVLPVCRILYGGICFCFMVNERYGRRRIWNASADRQSALCRNKRGLKDKDGFCHVYIQPYRIGTILHQCATIHEQEVVVPYQTYEWGAGKVVMVDQFVSQFITREAEKEGKMVRIGDKDVFPRCVSRLMNEFWCSCVIWTATESFTCPTPDGSEVKIDVASNACHLMISQSADGSLKCYPMVDPRPSTEHIVGVIDSHLDSHWKSVDESDDEEASLAWYNVEDPAMLAQLMTSFLPVKEPTPYSSPSKALARSPRSDSVGSEESARKEDDSRTYPIQPFKVPTDNIYTFRLRVSLKMKSIAIDNHVLFASCGDHGTGLIGIRDQEGTPHYHYCETLQTVEHVCEIKVDWNRVQALRERMKEIPVGARRELRDARLCIFGAPVTL